MANIKILTDEIEEYVRKNFLTKRYKQRFVKKKMKLIPGGSFEFDAVSEKEDIVACISASSYKPGPYRKIYHDIYFLTQIKNKAKKLVLLTQEDLFNKFVKEKKVKELHRMSKY